MTLQVLIGTISLGHHINAIYTTGRTLERITKGPGVPSPTVAGLPTLHFDVRRLLFALSKPVGAESSSLQQFALHCLSTLQHVGSSNVIDCKGRRYRRGMFDGVVYETSKKAVFFIRLSNRRQYALMKYLRMW